MSDMSTDTTTPATDRELVQIEGKARASTVMHWPELVRMINRLRQAEEERDRLREALRENFCPRPFNNRPDKFDVGDCVDAGECGCMNRAALAKEPGQ